MRLQTMRNPGRSRGASPRPPSPAQRSADGEPVGNARFSQSFTTILMRTAVFLLTFGPIGAMVRPVEKEDIAMIAPQIARAFGLLAASSAIAALSACGGDVSYSQASTPFSSNKNDEVQHKNNETRREQQNCEQQPPVRQRCADLAGVAVGVEDGIRVW